eukprot:TRINITY_DN42285_c0_g1_i1.p2 TRINITY_DN42285_c0_g1~~TRINITY_DN42285_c0_g1_i1.p2  ORF type:complete len:109 (+),score=1.39 TRINITY_DN42285_c0_g1_i1:2-328(+)
MHRALLQGLACGCDRKIRSPNNDDVNSDVSLLFRGTHPLVSVGAGDLYSHHPVSKGLACGCGGKNRSVSYGVVRFVAAHICWRDNHSSCFGALPVVCEHDLPSVARAP